MNALATLNASRQAEGRRRMTHFAPEPFENPLTLDHAALALSPVPVLGDVAGLAADAYDWYEHPENRGVGNALLIGAGVLPFVPPVAAGARVVGNKLMDGLDAVAPGSPRAQVGAIAWHGSPHKFPPTENNSLGEFDTGKIRIREGQQIWGPAFHLAEDPDVTRAYKTKQGTEGHLYKVDIPDHQIARMLDWTKPIGHQTPEVQEVIQKLGVVDKSQLDMAVKIRAAMKKGAGDDSATGIENLPVGDIYGSARARPALAKALREAGIPGIRYKDQVSRDAQRKSKYVVFDPAITRILGRD